MDKYYPDALTGFSLIRTWLWWSDKLGLFTVPVLAIYLGIVLCISRYAFWFVKRTSYRITLSGFCTVVLFVAPFSGIVISNLLLDHLCNTKGGLRFHNEPSPSSGLDYSSYNKNRWAPYSGCFWNCMELLEEKEFPYVEMHIVGKHEYVKDLTEGIYRFSLANAMSSTCMDYFSDKYPDKFIVKRRLEKEKKCLSVEKIKEFSGELTFERSQVNMSYYSFNYKLDTITLVESKNTKILEYKKYHNSYRFFGDLFHFYTNSQCEGYVDVYDFKPKTFSHHLKLMDIGQSYEAD